MMTNTTTGLKKDNYMSIGTITGAGMMTGRNIWPPIIYEYCECDKRCPKCGKLKGNNWIVTC